MYSGERERIEFVDQIDPGKRNVEDWMGDLEEMMKTSVKHELLKSIDEYK